MHAWESLAHVRWECKYHVVIMPRSNRPAESPGRTRRGACPPREGRRLREQKTLGDSDWQINPSIRKKVIFDLATGRFIREARDAIFLGPPGTGKSHLC
jgi:hypothetical protein